MSSQLRLPPYSVPTVSTASCNTKPIPTNRFRFLLHIDTGHRAMMRHSAPPNTALAACMNPSAKKFPPLLKPLVTDDADSTMKTPNSDNKAVTAISIVTIGESASNGFRS
ncbi:unannotated protein [freshwater metagenome]|uniref:Unannotated protein n=1 Tax=freshwater metagenome TaxID=449393 RepID=A0A6J6EQW8_9ZZZZ